MKRTKRDDSIGSSVKATSSDIATAKAMVSANCLKNWPTMPVMNPTGRNTARIVKVVAITARPISAVPSRAACIGSLPISMWRKMFSRTTTASSMRMPMTSDSAISDIMLKVKPAMYMKKNVATTEVGSASAVIRVERQSRMNRKMTSTAMIPPNRMWLRTSRTFSLMKSASLWTGRICRSGNDGATRASTASTRSVISTVLAPDCLRTANDTASAPSSRVVVSRSSKPSTTVPTSRTRTVEPPSDRRMTPATSSAPLNSPLVRSVTLRPSRSTLPPGRSRFSAASRAATSVIGMARASSRRGSRLTWISRIWPPLISTAATPSICSSSGFSSSSTWRRTRSEGWLEPTA